MFDPDSVANELLRHARLDTGEPFALDAIPQALGFQLIVAPTPALHGQQVPGLIVYDGTRRALAHELGHLACALVGLPVPHDERFVTSVGVCLTTPSRVVDRALRMGFERADLSSLFGVSHTCVVLRRAERERRPAAVLTPTKVYARGGWQVPAEDLLRRQVKMGAKWLKQVRLADDPRRILVVPR